MEGTTLIGRLNFLYGFDGPEEAPVILISNPLTTNLYIWDSIFPSLSKKYHILRYDQRGHGKQKLL
jgi:3-oxoadipate enol-lactonase